MALRLLRVVTCAAALVAGVVFVLGASGAGGATGSAQARWVVTDLGTLGGKESSAAAINERGQVVGYADTRSKGIYHAFLWEKGRMRDLGGFTGDSSADDINDSGQVVGVSDARAKDLSGEQGSHAFLWQNGKLRDVTPKPKIDRFVCYSYDAGMCRVYGAAINGRGSVVVSMTSTGNLHDDGVFLWQNGRLIDLGSLGKDPIDEVYFGAINDHDQIVGNSETGVENEDGEPISHAFLWQKGRMITLGSFAGASGAADVNERGQVVLSGETEATDEHGDRIWQAFLWQKGKMTDLGTLGGSRSNAAAINERGQIVGWSDTGTMKKNGDPISHAFVWQDGTMTDLGVLPGPTERNVDSYAAAINERGQIIGCGRYDAQNEVCVQAAVWQNGKMTKLDTLGGSYTEAVAINEHNQIVGYSTTRTGRQHAALWTLRG